MALDLLLFAALCVAAVLAALDWLPAIPPLLRLDVGYGIGAFYTYGKWLLTALLLALAWQRLHQPLLLSLVVIFILLLVDDSLKLHLMVGEVVAASSSFPDVFGLGRLRLGKLVAWLAFGSLCAVLFTLGYARSSAAMRSVGHRFLLGLAGLVLFGVVMDLLYVLTYRFGFDFVGRAMRFAFVLIEEGGEMVIASLLLAFALTIALDANARGRANGARASPDCRDVAAGTGT